MQNEERSAQLRPAKIFVIDSNFYALAMVDPSQD
jgi:hypothetical protein